MSEGKPKKRLLKTYEKIFLGIALLIIVYFVLTKLGISIGTVTDDTQMIDPYNGQ